MRWTTRWTVPGILSLAALVAVPLAAGAAVPDVYSTAEGRDTESGKPVLVLLGNSLTACKTFELAYPDATPAGDLVLEVRSKNLLVLALPESLPQGTYTLTLGYGKGQTVARQVVLANGLPLPGTLQDSALSPP